MPNGCDPFRGTRWARTPVSGFTMTELLVVVAVFMALVSLLIPSMRSVREGARKVECTGKLRQLYGAQVAYSTDWRGFILPTSATDPSTGQYRSYWNTGLLNNYLTKNSMASSDQVNHDVYGCQKAREMHGVAAAKQTYGQNDNIQEFSWRMGSMATPSSTVFIGDGAFVYRILGPSWFEMIADMGGSTDPYHPANPADDDRFPDGPHDGSQASKGTYELEKGNKANFVFFDGHVETKLWSSIPPKYSSTFWKLR